MSDNNNLFEDKSITKTLLKLAYPTVIGQIILVVYNLADTFFIGMANDNAKMTAVTICMPAYMILTAIANLFGTGGSSVIARALGKVNLDRAKATSAFSFWMGLVCSLVYSLVLWLFINPIVNMLGGTDIIVHEQAVVYMKWTMVYCGFATTLNALMAHLVRSEGKVGKAGTGVALGGILNVLLDPLFMFVLLEPGNEVLGAAVATAVSNFISFLYFVFVFISGDRNKTVLSFKLTRDSFSKGIPKSVLQVGIPACIMTVAENVSYAVLDKLMSAYGLAAQAGVGVSKKVNMLAHSIVRGITQGALPLLGYNYSSGQRQKTQKVVNATVILATGSALVCTLICLFFGKWIIQLFIQEDNEAFGYSLKFLKVLCIGGPFSAFAYSIISFFQAVGHGEQSFALALLRKGTVDIPMMFVFRIPFESNGIVLATPFADILACITAVILFSLFGNKHLRKNKPRKVYNSVTGQNEIVEGV